MARVCWRDCQYRRCAGTGRWSLCAALELFACIGDDVAVGLGKLQGRAHMRQLPGMRVAEAQRAAQHLAHLDIGKELVLPGVQVTVSTFLTQTADRATLLRTCV